MIPSWPQPLFRGHACDRQFTLLQSVYGVYTDVRLIFIVYTRKFGDKIALFVCIVLTWLQNICIAIIYAFARFKAKQKINTDGTSKCDYCIWRDYGTRRWLKLTDSDRSHRINKKKNSLSVHIIMWYNIIFSSVYTR